MYSVCRSARMTLALAVFVELFFGTATLDAQTQPAPLKVTYGENIAPLFRDRCISCHAPGRIAPFSLLTYDEVRPRAREIVRAVATRNMPPWKPEPGRGDFAGERRLRDDEIALIRRWADEGFAQGGVAAANVEPAQARQFQSGQPDLVVSLPEAYTLPAGSSDVFRTFVVPIPSNERRYVKALEFNPGNFKVVHHANIKIDRTRFSRRWDENEPGPGYEGGGSREAKFPDGHFMGWTPGQSPKISPPDMAWTLERDSDLVVELHLMPGSRPETIQFSVGLFFTDRAPTRVPYMLRLGRQDLDIPAGARAYVSEDAFVLPVDVQVLEIQPHAHYLARDIHGFAKLPDGSIRELIYIKDWDFHWQDVYTYRSPVALPRGTTVAMRYVYDNSSANPRNPNRPPKRVTFGQTSTSEMGSLWLQVLPLNPADRGSLDAAVAPKMLSDDIAGNQKWLEMRPGDAGLHAELAACYAEAGRLDEAVVELKEALRLDPAAGRYYDLGLALVLRRSFDDATLALERALNLKPSLGEAVMNLGVIAHAQGRVAEAIAQYRRARDMGLDDTSVHYNLARALEAEGKSDEAIAEYRRTIELSSEDAEAHRALGHALFGKVDLPAAVSEYRRAIQIDPDLAVALADLAWILVSTDRAEFQDSKAAVRLAEHAADVTRHQDPSVLDILAAAYLATSQPDRAIATAESALAIASSTGQDELAMQLRLRLDYYRRHR